MSRAPHETINVRGAEIGNDQYPPQSAPNEASQEMSNFVDGSGPIFSMYLEMASEEDKKMAENWKADADGILIFTGLYSAAVASLISVSIQDIRPNPVDTSNFYLANIYQTVADPSRSNVSGPLPATPPAFSPPNYAVWVNALWFMSLVISLTCALLATLLQQWARRYLKVTQPRYSPHKRARTRAFFFEGVEKHLLPWAVEALPALLHISLFLFFAGLVVFLCNVHITIFKLVFSWVGVCAALYGCITAMPIFCRDSPYYTSLSSLVWLLVIGIPYVFYQVRFWLYLSVRFRRPVFRKWRGRWHKLLLQGMQSTAEETALNLPSEIDARALMWTFDSLDEDHELERFFAGLPGFRSSKVVKDPLPGLALEQKRKLSTGLMGLLGRTFSSDLLPESIKNRRAIISARAIDPAHMPGASSLINRTLSYYQDSGPLAADIEQIVRGWGNNTDENTILAVRATVSGKLARARRDDSWFILASDELQVPEIVLREYAADSLSLAILIHIARQQFTHFRKPSWPSSDSWYFLTAASSSNVKDTRPELQHEFCALWNRIVREAQNNSDQWMAYVVLAPIRKAYIDLHEDTDSFPTRFSASTESYLILSDPTSYPVCNVAGHIHDSASTMLTAPVSASLASPDATSSSAPAPHHVDKSLADVPPLDNDTYVPGTFLSARQTTIENLRIPVTSPGPATVDAIRDIVTSGIMMLHPAPETSSTSPPAAVALQRNAADALNLPSSNPVLDIIPPTDPHLIVITAPSASPGPNSAPDLGVASEGDGGFAQGKGRS